MIVIRNDIENSPNWAGGLFERSRNDEISNVRTGDIDIHGCKRKYFYIMKVIYNIKLIVNAPKIDVRTVQQFLNRGISK